MNMLGIFSFWKKKKPAMVRDTKFLCPEETEKAQKDIDDAHKKNDATSAALTQASTCFGLEIAKLNGKA